jgi:hypothetical protein
MPSIKPKRIEAADMPAERRACFVTEAQAARKQMLRTGKGYDADEVHACLKARIAGKKPAKPEAKPWRS